MRQRRREIAIRMALGAGFGDVVREVAGHGLRPALLGLVAGALAAAALGRFVGSRLPELSAPAGGATLAAVAILAIALGAACLQPTLRAARGTPIASLRDE